MREGLSTGRWVPIAGILLSDLLLVLLLMGHVSASDQGPDNRGGAFGNAPPGDVPDGSDLPSNMPAVASAPSLSWLGPPTDRSSGTVAFAWMPAADRCDYHEHRRFCDGPRRVPRPAGPSWEVARRVGLGTVDAAAKLLRSRPRPEWTRLVETPRPATLRWPVPGGRYGRGVGFTRGDAPGLRHDGVDIGAQRGAPVQAAADGLVAYSDNGIRGYGNLLILLHGGGTVSIYAHLREVRVHAGQRVDRGQAVGIVGRTGIARGDHLHFEWHDDGDPVDPMGLFDSPGEATRGP